MAVRCLDGSIHYCDDAKARISEKLDRVRYMLSELITESSRASADGLLQCLCRREVAIVECENPCNTVNSHRSD